MTQHAHNQTLTLPDPKLYRGAQKEPLPQLEFPHNCCLGGKPEKGPTSQFATLKLADANRPSISTAHSICGHSTATSGAATKTAVSNPHCGSDPCIILETAVERHAARHEQRGSKIARRV